MHTTVSEPSVPIYWAIDMSGSAVVQDRNGNMQHPTESTTTLEEDIRVVFHLV